MVALGGDAAPRAVDRDARGGPAPHLRLSQVDQPQLQPGAEEAAPRRPRSRPSGPRCRRRGCHGRVRWRAAGRSARRGPQSWRAAYPAVDHQDDLAEPPRPVPGGPARVRAGRAGRAGGSGGAGLALVEQGDQVSDDPAYPLRLGPPSHPADMRQVPQRIERTPAEVQAVDLHLGRSVGERQATDHGPEQVGLAGARPTDHGHLPGRAGEGEPQWVLPVLQRLVHQADRDPQAAVQPAILRREPAP